MNHTKSSSRLIAICLVAWASLVANRAVACPGCSQIDNTFAQDIKQSDVAIVAELIERPPVAADGEQFVPGLGDTLPKLKFRVLEVLKGAEHLKDVKTIETIYFGDSPVGTQFFVTGFDPKNVVWGTPTQLSKRALQYIADGMKLPESGPERLAYYMNYLEDEDEILRRDSYDEFAISNYEDLRALAPRMPHAELIARLKNPEITGYRRRLYFTMIGACGDKNDLPFLESLLKSTDRKQKEGLDAIIGCYLAIKGSEGLKLVDELYFKNSETFVDTNAALQAVRIAEESTNLKKEEAAAAFRSLLGNPKMADLVIPDLARWQDWTAIDRLVELFIKADDETNWVRVPVLRYLQVCPLPEAKRQLARLEKIDPESAKRASAYSSLSGLISGAKAPAGSKKAPADDKTETTAK